MVLKDIYIFIDMLLSAAHISNKIYLTKRRVEK